VKPYECKLCRKSFSSSSNLKQHENVHKNLVSRKKFSCFINTCTKNYLYVCTLKKHLQYAHSDEYLKIMQDHTDDKVFYDVYKKLKESNSNTNGENSYDFINFKNKENDRLHPKQAICLEDDIEEVQEEGDVTFNSYESKLNQKLAKYFKKMEDFQKSNNLVNKFSKECKQSTDIFEQANLLLNFTNSNAQNSINTFRGNINNSNNTETLGWMNCCNCNTPSCLQCYFRILSTFQAYDSERINFGNINVENLLYLTNINNLAKTTFRDNLCNLHGIYIYYWFRSPFQNESITYCE